MKIEIDTDRIAQVLREEYCSLHHEKPAVRISGDKIHLTTCCDDFQEKLERILNEEVCRQVEEAMDNGGITSA